MQISHARTLRGEWLADEDVSNACLSQGHERALVTVHLFPFVARELVHIRSRLLFRLFPRILVDSVQFKHCYVVRLLVLQNFRSKSSMPLHEEPFEASVYAPSWRKHHVLHYRLVLLLCSSGGQS